MRTHCGTCGQKFQGSDAIDFPGGKYECSACRIEREGKEYIRQKLAEKAIPAKAGDKKCKTCRWAKWQYTPTGRAKRNEHGSCSYKVTWPKIPTAMQVFLPEKAGMGIWWNDDSTDCPCWEDIPEGQEKGK
jgi:hypothetical protein